MSEKIINLTDNVKNENEVTTEVKAELIPVVDLTDKTDEEIIKLAKERIDEQSNISSGPVPAILIYKWIMAEINTDIELAKAVLNKSKVLQKAFDYVMTLAKKRAEKQRSGSGSSCVCVGMADSEIFDLMKEYYFLDDKEIEKRTAKKPKSTSTANTTSKSNKKPAAKKSSSKKSEKKDDKKVDEKQAQLNLMDLFGGCE